MENPFILGRYYNPQSEIHGIYGGNRQSGILASAKVPFIFLFTGGSGQIHGYNDEWNGEIFKYYGEGQQGDMTLSKGNKAVIEHNSKGVKPPSISNPRKRKEC